MAGSLVIVNDFAYKLGKLDAIFLGELISTKTIALSEITHHLIAAFFAQIKVSINNDDWTQQNTPSVCVMRRLSKIPEPKTWLRIGFYVTENKLYNSEIDCIQWCSPRNLGNLNSTKQPT